MGRREVIIMQNMQAAMDHLKTHQTYPATKAQLVAECNNLSDFSDADKQEFSSKLPEGTYGSAEEVMQALGWDAGMAGGGTPPAGDSMPPMGGDMPSGGTPPPADGGSTPPAGM